jgi:hypothetical protein
MTTLTEMIDLTIEQTRRPELQDITAAAVRTATLRAHHTDFFPRDLASHLLTYVPSNTVYYDFSNLSSSLPRLRSMKHCQSISVQDGTPVEQLEYREQDDLYASDGTRRPHVYTLLGDTLRIYPQLPTGQLMTFYYQNPNTAGLQYSSWIANMYPDELAAWAAAVVFARSGFAEMAQQFMELHVNPFRSMLVESHLLGNVS